MSSRRPIFSRLPWRVAAITLLMMCALTGCQHSATNGGCGTQLLFVGDSLTEQQGYPEACHQALQDAGYAGTSVTRLAKGGATPAQMLSALQDARWTLPPAGRGRNWAFVLAGTNAYVLDDVLAIRNHLVGRGWEVALVTPPPRQMPAGKTGYGFPHANKRFNDQLRLWAKAHPDALVIDIVKPLSDPSHASDATGEFLAPAYARDHTHLNAAGYRLMGRLVAQAMVEYQ